MSKFISPMWARKIKQEAAALKADEYLLHNRRFHRELLQTWQEHSPVMWERLQKADLADDLAWVLQERMWNRSKELRESGMPIPDAREQAEREFLMREPEDEAEKDRLESLPL
jgi:hypothetical protein